MSICSVRLVCSYVDHCYMCLEPGGLIMCGTDLVCVRAICCPRVSRIGLVPHFAQVDFRV